MLPSSSLICSLAKATPLSTFTVSPSLFWFGGGGKKLKSDSKANEWKGGHAVLDKELSDRLVKELSDRPTN